MLTPDICHHCHYTIPDQASICPGCGRRHTSVAPRLEDHPQRRSPLLRDARWVRRFGTATGWFGLGLALAGGARLIAEIDDVAAELDDDALLRIDHAGRLLAVAALICLAGAAIASAAFVRRTRRNTVALGLPVGLSSPWSLPCWLLPGAEARRGKQQVDQVWRSSSPLVGALPRRGSSRRLVSRVVLRWWSLWLWAPAAVALGVLVAHADDGALADERGFVAVATGALLVAGARALYDVVGIITVAHAHKTEELLRDRAQIPWDGVEADLEPLRG